MKHKFIWGIVIALVVWFFSLVIFVDKKTTTSAQLGEHPIGQSHFSEWAGRLWFDVMLLLLIYAVYCVIARWVSRRKRA